MSLNEQMQAGIDRILTESECDTDDCKWDAGLAWRCVRAAFAQGYQDGLAADPYPLTKASEVEREAWARLPAS